MEYSTAATKKQVQWLLESVQSWYSGVSTGKLALKWWIG
jgi:hypothetical protein